MPGTGTAGLAKHDQLDRSENDAVQGENGPKICHLLRRLHVRRRAVLSYHRAALERTNVDADEYYGKSSLVPQLLWQVRRAGVAGIRDRLYPAILRGITHLFDDVRRGRACGILHHARLRTAECFDRQAAASQ